MGEEVGGVEGRRIPLYCMGRGAQQQRREYVERECVERVVEARAIDVRCARDARMRGVA